MPLFRLQSIPTALRAFARAVRAFFRGQDLTVPEEVYAQRLRICRACPYYAPETEQCTHCTCFVPLKARLVTEQCPLAIWPKV